MTKQIRARLILVLLLTVLQNHSGFAQQPPIPTPIDPAKDPFRVGFALSIFADESDFVMKMDTQGPCDNSQLYHLRRDSTNFKEAVAVALAAVSIHGRVTVKVTGCYPPGSPDPYSFPRNVISRVAVGGPE